MWLACFRFVSLGDICGIAHGRVQFTGTLACIVLALALGYRSVVAKPPSVDEVR